MSNLEVFVFAASLVFALKGWIAWYADLFSVNRLRDQKQPRIVLFVTPILALALLTAVLEKLSAPSIRNDSLYFAFYVLLGAAWLAGATLIFPFLGVSARDDVLERSNISAIWPVSGALLGVSCSFAGANVGNGPGVEVILFSAALSSGLFFVLWFCVDFLTSSSETITVERDESAGIRMGGFLIGIGLLSGWSVAGDWISLSATLKDLCRSAWPAVLLTATAVVVERVLGRATGKDSSALSSIISVLYVSLAIMWIVVRGFRS